MESASGEVLDYGSGDLNGGIVVVEEAAKWCGRGIYGEVVGEMIVQNLGVLVEGVFRIGLERVFVVMDWSFLAVVHLRKIKVGGGIVRARVVSSMVIKVLLMELRGCEVFVE
ncbi:hypothetical protein Tco_1150925 [Tanacetum coccineum]